MSSTSRDYGTCNLSVAEAQRPTKSGQSSDSSTGSSPRDMSSTGRRDEEDVGDASTLKGKVGIVQRLDHFTW